MGQNGKPGGGSKGKPVSGSSYKGARNVNKSSGSKSSGTRGTRVPK